MIDKEEAKQLIENLLADFDRAKYRYEVYMERYKKLENIRPKCLLNLYEECRIARLKEKCLNELKICLRDERLIMQYLCSGAIFCP